MYYSNYFPREVESTWPSEAAAQKRANELNSRPNAYSLWNVEKTELAEQKGDADLNRTAEESRAEYERAFDAEQPDETREIDRQLSGRWEK